MTPTMLADTNHIPDVTWQTEFVTVNEKSLFVAGDRETGMEIWQSDGTPDGTGLLHDLWPGTASGAARGPTGFFGADAIDLHGAPDQSAAYFVARRDHRSFLMTTDGRESHVLFPGQATILAATERGVYFHTQQVSSTVIDASEDIEDALFVHDVFFASAESRSVRYLGTVSFLDDESGLYSIGTLDERLLMRGCDFDGDVCQVWSTDAESGEFRVLSDLDLSQLIRFQGADYLWGFRSPSLYQIESDGLREAISTRSRFHTSLIPLGNETSLFFTDGGRWMAITSPRAEAVVLAEPNGYIRDTLSTSEWHYILNVNGTEHQIWVSNGTVDGTRQLQNHPFEHVDLLATIDNDLLYTTTQDGQSVLWRIEGHEPGAQPRRVLDLPTDEYLASTTASQAALDARGRLLFATEHESVGKQFWVADLEEDAGHAEPLAASSPGTMLSQTWRFQSFGEEAVFLTRESGFANVFPNRQSVWVTDGTPEGTRPMAQGIDDFITDVFAVDHGLLVTSTGNRGFITFRQTEQLWTVDATGDATRLASFATELEGADVQSRVVYQGRLVFVAKQEAETALWVSDGTVAGTERLATLPLPDAGDIFVADGYVFIQSIGLNSNGTFASERQWFQSDGTTAGTGAAEDVPPRPSEASREYVVGDRTFFTYELNASYGRWWGVRDANGQETQLRTVDFRLSESVEPIVVGDDLYFMAQTLDGRRDYVFQLRNSPYPEVSRVVDLPVSPTSMFRIGNRIVVGYDDGVHGIEPAVIRILRLDVDQSGYVGDSDLGLLCAALHSGDDTTELDVNLDGVVDALDLDDLLRYGLRSTRGDVNRDGRFDSSDLVQVFQGGQYEDDETDNSDYFTGDWNCDGEFDSSDLVAAFQSSRYEG